MVFFDWEATALDSETRERRWLQGQFTVSGKRHDTAVANANVRVHKVVAFHAAREGCDPETVEIQTLASTTCNHADFEENPMDDSATCQTCGKYFKGFAD